MPSSSRVVRHATDLRLLGRAKAAVRKRKIRDAPKDLIMALVDVAKALIKGEISLSSSQLGAVRRQKKNFLSLVRPGKALGTLKKTLQTGGFLSALLGPILKIAGPLLGGLFGGIGGGGR